MVEFYHFKTKSLSEDFGRTQLYEQKSINIFIYFYLRKLSRFWVKFSRTALIQINIWHKKCLFLKQYWKFNPKITITFSGKKNYASRFFFVRSKTFDKLSVKFQYWPCLIHQGVKFFEDHYWDCGSIFTVQCHVMHMILILLRLYKHLEFVVKIFFVLTSSLHFSSTKKIRKNILIYNLKKKIFF